MLAGVSVKDIQKHQKIVGTHFVYRWSHSYRVQLKVRFLDGRLRKRAPSATRLTCYGNTIVSRMIWFDRFHLKRRLTCDTLLPKDGNTQTKDEESGDDSPIFHIGLSLNANGKSLIFCFRELRLGLELVLFDRSVFLVM